MVKRNVFRRRGGSVSICVEPGSSVSVVSVPSVLIVAALLLSFAGAAAAQFMPGNADQVRRITVAELKRLMDEGEVIVLDVRTPWEFEAGHIPGSRFVPLSRVDQQAAELRAERKPIVTYCT